VNGTIRKLKPAEPLKTAPMATLFTEKYAQEQKEAIKAMHISGSLSQYIRGRLRDTALP
jgi:hypothetical protein